MPRPKLHPTEEQRRMGKTMTAMEAKHEEIVARIVEDLPCFVLQPEG